MEISSSIIERLRAVSDTELNRLLIGSTERLTTLIKTGTPTEGEVRFLDVLLKVMEEKDKASKEQMQLDTSSFKKFPTL